MTSHRRWLAGAGSLLIAAGVLWTLTEESPQPAPQAAQSQSEATPPEAPLYSKRPAPTPSVVTSGAAPTASPSAPPSAPPEEIGTRVVSAPWGGAPGQVGRLAANESSPEGPMSFVVDRTGNAWVLDQVNARVQVFDGDRLARIIPLPSETFQDVALTETGQLRALDRLGTGSVAMFDDEGTLTHEVALVGEAIEDAGDVTALEQREDGTWVEVRHANLVRIADAAGAPLLERDVAPGRFADALDGHLRASRSSFGAAVTLQKRGARPEVLAKLRFSMRVGHLTGLESDRDGNVFLSAHLYEESPEAPFELLNQADVLVTLSPTGRELSRLTLPPEEGAEESFRRLRVGADGALYHLGFGKEAATLRRVSR